MKDTNTPARYIGPGIRIVVRGRRGERKAISLPCSRAIRRCEKCRQSDLACGCASWAAGGAAEWSA